MKVATIPTADLLPVALRDTARTIVKLRSDSPPSLETLRAQCNAQLASLRDELQHRSQPRDVIDDALYALCAVLDEAALRGLTGDEREVWEREPLQLRAFGRNDAGEELFRRIRQRLREPTPVLPLLAIFAAVLDLGFTGRFAVNGGDARDALVREIDERLTRAAGGTRHRGAPDRFGPVVVSPSRARRHALSPLAWVLIASVAAGLAWFTINRALLASIASSAQ
ncbi:DotU family type IV/VI secretion system protein [Paraburkholderia terricola]|uniref:DotU family type IV/VI secretion system protein n=1 Tax=Paraburkholderia terricola TaxID=169427 RepID=UPI0028549214|nr:DotU family type IV/VI secretion system protein [Paraburkholderia terricola]MDR6482652.1 type VI secretion system protein ImpK [Paraburkholderia terricola]